MKAKRIFGITLVTAILAIQSSFGQATAYANIYATVVAPVGLSNSEDLSVGTIELSQSKTDLFQASKNEIIASGIKVAQDGNALLASFDVTDLNRSTFDITLPSEDLIIGGDSNSSMTISTFSSSNYQTITKTTTKNAIKIAASIKVSENQMIANYNSRNPLPITLNFN